MTPAPGLPWLLAAPEFLMKAAPYLVALFFYGQVFANTYGAVKIIYQRIRRRAFPVNKATRTLDAVVELLPNALGFVNKVLPAVGLPPLFIPPAPDLRAYMTATSGAVVVLPPALPPGSTDTDATRPSVTVHRDGTVDVHAAPGTSVLLPPASDGPTGPAST